MYSIWDSLQITPNARWTSWFSAFIYLQLFANSKVEFNYEKSTEWYFSVTFMSRFAFQSFGIFQQCTMTAFNASWKWIKAGCGNKKQQIANTWGEWFSAKIKRIVLVGKVIAICMVQTVLHCSGALKRGIVSTGSLGGRIWKVLKIGVNFNKAMSFPE